MLNDIGGFDLDRPWREERKRRCLEKIEREKKKTMSDEMDDNETKTEK
jgi:hypothetical protein